MLIHVETSKRFEALWGLCNDRVDPVNTSGRGFRSSWNAPYLLTQRERSRITDWNDCDFRHCRSAGIATQAKKQFSLRGFIERFATNESPVTFFSSFPSISRPTHTIITIIVQVLSPAVASAGPCAPRNRCVYITALSTLVTDRFGRIIELNSDNVGATKIYHVMLLHVRCAYTMPPNPFCFSVLWIRHRSPVFHPTSCGTSRGNDSVNKNVLVYTIISAASSNGEPVFWKQFHRTYIDVLLTYIEKERFQKKKKILFFSVFSTMKRVRMLNEIQLFTY